MKILYITTIGGTMSFFTNLIKDLIDEGHTVDIATNETVSKVPQCYSLYGCKVYPITTSRSPFSFGNFKAIKQIRKIAEDYDIVHCHTPLAGMATRLACKSLIKHHGTKVIYTAHGFHFYKGAPLINWLLYYPIEKICSKWTDVLITINKEDYELAKMKMKAKRVEYVPGVGIDAKKFANVVVDRDRKREELGIPKNAILILSVGELNKNKNHQIVIRAIHELNDPNIYYMIAGQGALKERLEKLASDLNVNLRLLGYRNDIGELCKVSDIFVFPSIREGHPIAVLEAMACGLPVISSKNRGTDCFSFPDYCLCAPNEPTQFSASIKDLLSHCETIEALSVFNKNRAAEYSKSYINAMMKRIYEEYDK